MLEWEIPFGEYLKRIHLGPEYFEDELCLPRIYKIEKVLPLKNLKEIHSVLPITNSFLLGIVKKIKTIDNQSPFKNATAELTKVDSNQLKVGQKFVYRENYQNMLENLPKIFKKFAISSGLSDLDAYMVFGADSRKNYCLSYYIPPIVEQHNDTLVIMDGVHRNYINKQWGTTLKAILIKNINVPFPCSFHPWNEIEIIPLKNKPKDIEKRYFDLNPNLFRDLKYLGIDG